MIQGMSKMKDPKSIFCMMLPPTVCLFVTGVSAKDWCPSRGKE